jgi:Cu/Ag efflux pump CusA
LHELATIRLEEGPTEIRREDGKRRIVVGVNVQDRDLGGFVPEFRDRAKREVTCLPDTSGVSGQPARRCSRPSGQAHACASLRHDDSAQRPLVIVVIGGLTTSTLLTVIVLPALCPYFDDAVRSLI